jgi:uncharacterized iron-regulated membrane protein
MVSAAALRSGPAVRGSLYATFWRWHFYAGLFVLPFILILSVTGAIYLFKPQIERWEERAWIGLGAQGAVSPDRQLAVARASYPGARFAHYRLPRAPGDAAMIRLSLPDGSAREVFVSPQGRVVGSLVPDDRIAPTVSRIHGTLLIGEWGDWLVELAASWTIVMILTGLYLWWPRPLRLAGTLWPRLHLRGRPLLKDLHRVIGLWIAGLVLVTLASGLPWAGVWGGAFARVRAELGLVKGPAQWRIGVDRGHGKHVHGPLPENAGGTKPVSASLPLAGIVARAEAERLPYPVLVLPPYAVQAFGPPTGNVWTVKSMTQVTPLRREIRYDPASGAVVSRSGFADQHPIDRAVSLGIAWHEGQLFGWINQLIGLLTALGLVAVSLLGVWMWLRRRPAGGFGAPAAPPLRHGWVIAAVALLGILLPLFGASVLAILLVDRLRHSVLRPRSG